MTSLMRKLLPGIVIAFTLITATFASGSPLVVTATPTPVIALNAGAMQQFSATKSGGGGVIAFWTVSGIGCAGFGCGSISVIGGLYSAPAVVASPILVTITATSTTDWTLTGSVTITVNPGLSQGAGPTTVSITPPGPLQLLAGASQPFSATVVGPANTNVTWSVGGISCSGNCGTITQAGVYTAPALLTSVLSATITATSQATPSASASVTVQLNPVVAIAMGPFNPQMAPGTSQQLSAKVTDSVIQSVQWTVSGASCAGPSCGTISPSGLYTAPAGLLTTMNVTVKATAVADSSKFATAIIAVGPIVVMTVSPTPLSLSVGAGQQYSVSITGAANTAVNWSVTGAGCSGLTCGMVAPISGNTALYNAPAAIPSPANVNVTATLVSDPSKSGSAVATIVPLSNNRLNGQYAFLFRGFDAKGTYQAAGSFTADGNGNLTNGVMDINCGFGAGDPICASGPVLATPLTGTYTVSSDARGTMTITSALGTQTFTFALNSANTKGRFVESDTITGIRGSGVLELQNPLAFAAFTTSFGSSFSFSLSGVDSSNKPLAAIGNMLVVIDPPYIVVPTIETGKIDVNDNGSVSCYPQEFGTSPCLSSMTKRFTGTYSVGPNGRGTASFSLLGFDGTPNDTTTFNFSMYVISSGEFFLLSTDPGSTANPVFSGQALQQTVDPTVALQAGPAVFSWSGVGTGKAAGVPQAAVGQVSMYDSLGNISGVDYDINNGGLISWGIGQGACSTTNKKGKIVLPTNCTYTVQPNNDVVVSSASNPQLLRVFPTTTNAGFLLGPSPGFGQPPSVTIGKIEAQSVAIPFPFMFGSDLMVAQNAPLISGTGSFGQPSVLASPVTGNEDESLVSWFTPNLPFNGTYGPTSLPNGRGFMYLDSTDVPTLDFWVVTANKTVAIDVDSGAVPNLVILEH